MYSAPERLLPLQYIATGCKGLTAFFLCTLLFISGCATLAVDDSDLKEAEKPQSFSSPTFEYNPSPSQESLDFSVGSTASSISYNTDINDELRSDDLSEAIDKFTKSSEGAFVEGVQDIMDSKGFSFAGRFQSAESMTFPDKDDTIMMVSIDVNTDIRSKIDSTREVYWRGAGGEPLNKPLRITYDYFVEVTPKYKQKGKFISNSTINIRVFEPLTGENLLVEELSTNELTEEFVWYYWFDTEVNDGKLNRIGKYAVEDYDGRRASISSLISKTHKNVLSEVDDIITGEKISKLTKDAKKLKQRWRTSNN
jgi:hypothetical protein